MRCWGCSDLNQAALAFKQHRLTGKQTQDSQLRSQNSEARIERKWIGQLETPRNP